TINMCLTFIEIFRKSVVNCEIPLETTRPMAYKQSENIPRSSMSSEVTMAEVDEQSEWVRRTVQETPNMSPPPRNVVVIKRRILESLSKNKWKHFFSKKRSKELFNYFIINDENILTYDNFYFNPYPIYSHVRC
ncbi:hypothetical protein SNEBB_000843, partial [Seison nebaliae]